MSIEAMKQWREALGSWKKGFSDLWQESDEQALKSIDQAIAEAEKQEPVAMQMDVIVVNLVREGINKHRARELAEHFIKHTRPQPKREWVGLTDEEIVAINDQHYNIAFRDFDADVAIARAIEAKLKEKNNG